MLLLEHQSKSQQVPAAYKSSPPMSMIKRWRLPAAGSTPRKSLPMFLRNGLPDFFTRVDETSWQVSKQVRETVTFAHQNLIADVLLFQDGPD